MNAKQATTRQTLIGLAHLGFARMNLGDTEYRDTLERMTGKRSCKELSDEQLEKLVSLLREQGILNNPRQPAAYPGGSGPDRPTDKQWGALEGLARKVGYGGLEDNGFKGFVRRVAKVDNPRFLTRTTVSKVIIGLQRWADQKAAKENQGGVA